MSEAFDTSCRKCGAPMRGPAETVWKGVPIYRVKLRITAYLCACGHWNNLKARKGWKPES